MACASELAPSCGRNPDGHRRAFEAGFEAAASRHGERDVSFDRPESCFSRVWFLGEPFTLSLAIGFVLILHSVAIITGQLRFTVRRR
jgi:hypothetical protein